VAISNPAADAKEVLDKYWADSGGNLRFPVDPIKIARQMGAEVYLADLDLGVSGQLEVDDFARTILLSRDNGPTRQRFTCAHEIGHLVDRENRPNAPRVFIDYRDGRSSLGTNPDEIYANQFAAELLMPADEVKKLVRQGWTTPSMSRRFGVSEAAMEIRRTNLRCG
jgi:hypothetical protein